MDLPTAGGLTATGLLHTTGGVGRLVAQQFELQHVSPALSVEEATTSPPLLAVCRGLLSHAPRGLPAGDSPWPLFGMHQLRARDLVSAAMESEATGGARREEALALVSEYLDRSFFHRTEDGELEPLVPADLAAVRDCIEGL